MKKLCFSFFAFHLLFLQAITAFSQTNNLYFYGNDFQDTKASLVKQNGNYYLIGKYGTNGHDILLSSLNNYAVEWSKTFDHGSSEEGFNFVADEDNNLFLSATGNNLSSTFFLQLSANGPSWIAVK